VASAIVKEPEINMAQFYAESLIQKLNYILEHYQPGRPADKNATPEDPNDYEPSSI
jgi:hypothetical protein